MKKNSYYITTTLPYVNDAPHIGFALEIVQADALARFKRSLGYDVVFNTGTDEHGVKIYEKAIAEHISTQTYCDIYAAKFDHLKDALNLSYTNFIRTTDPHHEEAAQYFWSLCVKQGDIYKKNYSLKYCKGCELEKTDSELEDGRCPIHPNMLIEHIEEENYFFRLSKYKDKLLVFYKANPHFVVPQNRYTEIINFVQTGLHDFSISRLKSKMPWGIPVPNDEQHVMYVWFDALVNYISTLGWPEEEQIYNRYWPAIQVAGKDNLRQQSSMWQGMLLSAGLPLSKQIFIHGFITANGEKMSKSLGNVVDPYKVIKQYGTDALRFYLLREISAYQDGDYSERRMEELYNAELANGLGNLVSRLTTLGKQDNIVIAVSKTQKIFNSSIIDCFDTFNFPLAVQHIWMDVRQLNKKINDYEPWKKSSTERRDFLIRSLRLLHLIGQRLLPIIPASAEIIIANTKGVITQCKPLFPRIKKIE